VSWLLFSRAKSSLHNRSSAVGQTALILQIIWGLARYPTTRRVLGDKQGLSLTAVGTRAHGPFPNLTFISLSWDPPRLRASNMAGDWIGGPTSKWFANLCLYACQNCRHHQDHLDIGDDSSFLQPRISKNPKTCWTVITG